MTEKVAISQFKGMKNDTDPKQTSFEYFSNIMNFNYQDTSVLGLEKILCPTQLNKIDDFPIDGIFEYRFLDSNNILRNKKIVVCNGSIYETNYNSKTLIKSGLSGGRCSFVAYQDKLFITNGIDNIQVYSGYDNAIAEMGAPYCFLDGSGFLIGTYRYAITYVTTGGEEVIGSVSESILTQNNKIRLTLPIGYTGTTKRRIYRTESNGTQLKFLREIANNTTTTFSDNYGDYVLTTDIPAITNELPRPYFLKTAGSKLFGGKVSKFPTQLFVTATFEEVFDNASFIDVSNFGNDNTAIEGVGEDFDKIVVGTGKNIFFVNPSDNSVVLTRANVGILDGYSLAKIPSFADFTGGLMFVSTAQDIRLMTGLQSLPVSTSLDNISTLNYAQDIQGTFNADVRSYQYLSAEYFNYKYHLQFDNIRYVFDIRIKGWTTQIIQTETYVSKPTYLAIVNNQLINGQSTGYLELEYTSETYLTEDCPAILESPEINAASQFSFIEKIYLWFFLGMFTNMDIEVITDSNRSYKQVSNFSTKDGAFNEDYLNKDFEENENGMDYRVFNIYSPCRWLKYKLSVNSGITSLQNFEISGQTISNKE